VEEAELEELRKRKFSEKQKEHEGRAVEQQLKDALRKVLTLSAYDRLTNVAIANKELYLTTAQQVLHASKQIGRQINEPELLTVLRAIKARTEKKSTIKFHKK